jgi:hypothetical protein
LFGGSKYVRDRRSDVYGWFIGEYVWREREVGQYGGDRAVERRVKTYITFHGDISRAGRGWNSDDLSGSGGYGFWEEIVSKMIILARERGVEVP